MRSVLTTRGLRRMLERFAYWTTAKVGSSAAFIVALIITLLWLSSGPLFHFSDTWQLVMNSLSSVITFLMVFLLQRSQNKEFLAIQLKLNELIASKRGASKRLINAEELSEQEVRTFHDHYSQLYVWALHSQSFTEPVSIEHALNGGRLSSPGEHNGNSRPEQKDAEPHTPGNGVSGTSASPKKDIR
jgi:low affinity Fe/Cu permease